MKTYKIKTIEDLSRVVTQENVENLMTDLKGVMLSLLLARAASNGNDDEIQMTEFDWIDDGKHEIHCTIEPK